MGHRSTACALAVLAALLGAGCGTDDNGVNPADRLCGGEAALALAVTGGPSPVDFCAAASTVSASLTAADRYDIRSAQDVSGTAYDVQMEIPNRTDAPVTLAVTADPAAAAADPMSSWFFYREIPASGDTLVTSSISSGTIVLSFSDGTVAAGTFSALRIHLENARTGAAAGTRTIDAGFFSVQVPR